MFTKLVELRDKATFIPCIAIKLEDDRNVESEEFLIRRAGFGFDNPMILFGRIDGSGKLNYDPYDWKDRTFQVAHDWLMKNWSTFQSGDVVDVEFILGESAEKKISELQEHTNSIEEREHVDQ